MSDWIALLKSAVENDPRGISGVADRLPRKDGKPYSRPAISRALSGTYGNTEHLQRVVLATLARIDCPHLQVSLAPQECADYAGRRYGAITAAEVPHWRACRKCPHNPANASANNANDTNKELQ